MDAQSSSRIASVSGQLARYAEALQSKDTNIMSYRRPDVMSAIRTKDVSRHDNPTHKNDLTDNLMGKIVKKKILNSVSCDRLDSSTFTDHEGVRWFQPQINVNLDNLSHLYGGDDEADYHSKQALFKEISERTTSAILDRIGSQVHYNGFLPLSQENITSCIETALSSIINDLKFGNELQNIRSKWLSNNSNITSQGLEKTYFDHREFAPENAFKPDSELQSIVNSDQLDLSLSPERLDSMINSEIIEADLEGDKAEERRRLNPDRPKSFTQSTPSNLTQASEAQERYRKIREHIMEVFKEGIATATEKTVNSQMGLSETEWAKNGKLEDILYQPSLLSTASTKPTALLHPGPVINFWKSKNGFDAGSTESNYFLPTTEELDESYTRAESVEIPKVYGI
ncbi:uncharacterized protein L201_003931 [Kwoniella dendrophila CBS 6074]|uniref:Transcriptional regulatory protein RXT2 N-terminal domain-containing protein n=1 Tax=Kwoniella dendrophila CBS 6074 TaxID=1295534 RepID=A0AAX4JVU6_9TREE